MAFLDLGGYGAYVWPAFAVAALVFVWMALSTLRRLRENERALERLQEIRRAVAETEREAEREPTDAGAAEGGRR